MEKRKAHESSSAASSSKKVKFSETPKEYTYYHSEPIGDKTNDEVDDAEDLEGTFSLF